MGRLFTLLLIASLCWAARPLDAGADLPVFVRSWGEEGCGEGQFESLRGLTWLSDGTLAVSDRWCFRIQLFDTLGTTLGTIAPVSLFSPEEVVVDGQWLFAYDGEHDEILRMTLAGEVRATIPADGYDNLDGISDFTVDANRRVLVVNRSWDAVKAFDLDGVPLPDESFYLSDPAAIAAGADGTVWIWRQGSMEQYDADWGLLQSWTGPTGNLADFVVAESGRLYCTISTEDQLAIYESDGTLVGSVGRNGSGPEAFNTPLGIAVSPTGWIAVADRDNYRVQLLRIGFTPVRSTTWGRIKTRY
jgi:hypothetical protein